MAQWWLAVLFLCLVIFGSRSASAQRTFNLNNACSYTVWPATLSNAGLETLWQGGTTLAPGAAYQYVAPAGWAGRIWGRTGCSFDATNLGTCSTGDCGKGLFCSGAGGIPPATLVEFTLDGSGAVDFYDVSLVDGYNLPLQVSAAGGTCGSPGCTSDLNAICPVELQDVVNGVVVACKSACEVFQTDQYCCRNTYASPAVCVATSYSQTFKSACPTAYSYAFDDSSSTFTCPVSPAPAYTITFCPGASSTVVGTPPAAVNSTVNTTAPPSPVVITTPPLIAPPPPPLILVPPPPNVSALLPPPPPLNATELLYPPPPPPLTTGLIYPPPPPPTTTGLIYPPPPPPTTTGLIYPPPPAISNISGLYPPPPPALGFLYPPPPPPFTVSPGPYSPPVITSPPYDSGTNNYSAGRFSYSISIPMTLLFCSFTALALAYALSSS